MIIYVKIHYGLGNQLFQYAMARSLSIALKVPFKLDLSFYKRKRTAGDEPRDYSLDVFNIIENIASDEEVKRRVDLQKST
jgi:O86/O127-antigen biosynthesis alpha-1,2-fucosyltransferase